jgi:hypothetical protein
MIEARSVRSSVGRLAKLRAMSLRELLARATYETYTAYERDQYRRGRLAPPDRLQRALDPAIARQSNWQDETRFFASVDATGRARALFASRFTDECQKARRVAAEVSRGEISFFGRRFSFGSEIDWHADPVSGAGWPHTYHRDVPVHRGDTGFGDVKYVWEINRHQFFMDLAKVAFLDNSPVHARAVHRLLRTWMAQVPYATGVPWACALEPAFRVWSWLWAYRLMRAAGMVNSDDDAIWLTGFHDHGRFLYRHLERYSSPYNHLIGEVSALFALGLLFPCFREAEAWRERGRRVLESALESQFHSDGGSVEQSTFYHHATLGFYVMAAVLGRRNGVELSPAVWETIDRGIQFSASLVQPNGRLPRIGGADDGKPIRMEHLPFWDFRPYQAIGAVMFARPDFKFVAGRFWEDAFWVLGPDAVDEFDRLPQWEPRPSVSLAASGYYVVRSGWTADADYLCFDCGPQAAGLRRDNVPSAAHGHADCLSVVVTLGGREVLVDPGFFCYNGDPRWEVDFRRTAAHNTISVNGSDQAEHVSKMAWIRTFSPRPEGWSAEEGWARGSHDGYVRNPTDVTHRRTAWLRPGGYVIIRDELTGTPGHKAQAVFQFAPGRLSIADSWALYDDRYELAWVCSTAPVRARVACGGSDPTAGWIAPSLGTREAAPRLMLEFLTAAPCVVLLTILMDRSRSGQPAGERVIAPVRAAKGMPSVRVAVEGVVDEVTAILDSTADLSTAPLITVHRVQDREGRSQNESRNGANVLMELT